MSEAQDFNPFDTSGYSTTPNVESKAVEAPQEQTAVEASQETAQQDVQNVQEPVQQNVQESVQQVEETQPETEQATQSDFSFEWPDEVSKNIYDKLVSGNITDLADMIYEQKVLSSLDEMEEADLVKLKMAYEYPDLTPEEIEEEYKSKYSPEDDVDTSLMTEDELAAHNRKFEKQAKSLARELKKEARDAKDYLSSMKKEISFPDILSQVQNANASVNPEEVVNQYLMQQEAQTAQVYEQARQDYLNSLDNGLRSFDGFNVNYKDEDVQFDGKYALTPEDKAALSSTLKDFDLEEFYGNRYFKDGKYDAKQLAEDVYFLQNRDKVVNSMITQAVSKAKADLLKAMKNIDYNDAPRVAASAASNDDYDSMVSRLYSL